VGETNLVHKIWETPDRAVCSPCTLRDIVHDHRGSQAALVCSGQSLPEGIVDQADVSGAGGRVEHSSGYVKHRNARQNLCCHIDSSARPESWRNFVDHDPAQEALFRVVGNLLCTCSSMIEQAYQRLAVLRGKRILGKLDQNVWQVSPFICARELALERRRAQNPSV
jgi:hypothetical protein